MLPHLVLNEQEKNERFRTSRIKKALLNQTQAAASSSLSMEEEAEDENMESEDLAQDAFDPSGMQGGDPLGLPPPQAGVSISYILSQPPSQPAGAGQVFQLKEETGVEREERGGDQGEDTMREWFMSRSGEDDIIRKYLHKKFTKSRREYVTEVVSDRGILRKSVIVPNIGYRPETKKEEGKEEEAEEGSSSLSPNYDLMRKLNAKASESIEENRLQVIKSNFEQSWRSIDFGEEMVNHFILYCQHKQELPLSHWMIANKHFRWARLLVPGPLTLEMFQGALSEIYLWTGTDGENSLRNSFQNAAEESWKGPNDDLHFLI